MATPLPEGAYKLLLRDAIVALYTGKAFQTQVASSFPGVSRRRATELANVLPKGRIESQTQQQLAREAIAAAGIKGNAICTEW